MILPGNFPPLPLSGLAARYDFLQGSGTTLKDMSVSGVNLLNPVLTSLSGWGLAGTPTPTYDSVADRVTYGAVGTNNYVVAQAAPHPGAGNSITIKFKGRGDGTLTVYYTDNQIGGGSNPATGITLTSTLTEFTHTTTFPTLTSSPITAVLFRGGGDTATYLEATDFMVNYGPPVPYEHIPFYGTLAAPTGSLPTWSGAGLSFDGVGGSVSLRSVPIGQEQTVIAVVTPQSFSVDRIAVGVTTLTSTALLTNTSGGATGTVNDSVQLRSSASPGGTVGTVGIPAMLTRRISQAGQYVQASLNGTHANPVVSTVGAHAPNAGIVNLVGSNNTGANYWLGDFHYLLLYNRVLNDSELAQVYTWLKGRLSQRGVSLP